MHFEIFLGQDSKRHREISIWACVCSCSLIDSHFRPMHSGIHSTPCSNMAQNDDGATHETKVNGTPPVFGTDTPPPRCSRWKGYTAEICRSKSQDPQLKTNYVTIMKMKKTLVLYHIISSLHENLISLLGCTGKNKYSSIFVIGSLWIWR